MKYDEMHPFLVDGKIANGGHIQTKLFVGNGFKPFPTVLLCKMKIIREAQDRRAFFTSRLKLKKLILMLS